MSFIRAFDIDNIIGMMSGRVDDVKPDVEFRFSKSGRYLKLEACFNASLFALLKADVVKGEVFPAVRGNELHFYYKGGCLYKFAGGAFFRDINYELYSNGTDGLSIYEKAKKQNENKYTNISGEVTERRLLDSLYCHTFNTHLRSNVVVLDIEVNLGGKFVRKCDLVLLNTQTDEIMFVEGKVYSDDRVRSAVGHIPKVIEQVNIYSAALAEQHQNILAQYGECIRIINKLFGTAYRPPQRLIQPAKLLVYKTGGGKTENVRYTIDIINEKLGSNNVMWVTDKNPTLAEIWNALNEEVCR